MLDALFPAQHGTLQDAYDGSLSAIPDGDGKDAGIAVGAMAAKAMSAATQAAGANGAKVSAKKAAAASKKKR